MSDTTTMRKAEAYVRTRHFGPKFDARKVVLTWGGTFAFDAVSPDGRTVALISTSRLQTAGGRIGQGKVNKILKDVLYLMAAKGAKHRVLVFTEPCMLAEFRRLQEVGRLPPSIVLERFTLNPHHRQRVRDTRRKSSDEVRPAPANERTE